MLALYISSIVKQSVDGDAIRIETPASPSVHSPLRSSSLPLHQYRHRDNQVSHNGYTDQNGISIRACARDASEHGNT
jgi:hypothetical protein